MVSLYLLIINNLAYTQPNNINYDLFESKTLVNGKYKLRYRLLWPENRKKGEKYPLFIFLHGMGQCGKNNQRQLKRGAEIFLRPENRTKYPCIVLYPQVPFGRSFIQIWKDGRPLLAGYRKFSKYNKNGCKFEISLSPYGKMVYEVIAQLIAENVVDVNRIYISGTSMGAFSAFQFISEYPIFAAAATMAGGTALPSIDNWAGKVPIWIIHGSKDPIIPVESSRLVVNKLKEKGITNYRYTEYKNARHFCWKNALFEQDYLEWFFSKHKE